MPIGTKIHPRYLISIPHPILDSSEEGPLWKRFQLTWIFVEKKKRFYRTSSSFS